MGALIARAICKKFTVSHTLLSGRPSRVCSALCRHCAGTARTRRSVRTGGAPLSGLRARSVPEVRADPRAALPRARRPRRRPARAARATGRPPRARGRRQRPQRAPPRRRPLRGHWSASSRESGQCASGSDSSYSGCVLRTVPLRRTAAPARPGAPVAAPAAPRPRTIRHGVGSPGRGG